MTAVRENGGGGCSGGAGGGENDGVDITLSSSDKDIMPPKNKHRLLFFGHGCHTNKFIHFSFSLFLSFFFSVQCESSS